MTYLRIIALATPFSAILFVGAACLRGAGDTQSPFFVLLVVNVVNVAVSFTLVLAPAPIGGHGIAGVAIGTVAAWVLGAALILRVLIGGRGGMRLRMIRLNPRWHTMKRIVNVGVPNLVEMFFAMWLANFIIIRIVGLIGQARHEPTWGAHIIAIRVEAMSFMLGFGLGTSAATLVGQYLGLGDPLRARRAAATCWAIGVGVMSFLGVLFVLMPTLFVRILTDDPKLIELAAPALQISGWVQFFFGSAMILGSAMRGAGATRATLLLTAGSTYLVRIPMAWLFGVFLDKGLFGLWIGLCIELVVRGCLFGAWFLRGEWAEVEV